MVKHTRPSMVVPLLAALLLLLSACGSNEPTPAPTAAEPPTTAVEPPAASEAVTETTEMTATEAVTTGAEVTATQEMTASEEITITEELTAAEGMTPTAQGEVIAEGLNGPMGVLVAEDGSIWVIDSGIGGEDELPFILPQTGEPITASFGLSARVVQISPQGEMQEITALPSVGTELDMIGGARLAMVDGTVYATVGQWSGDPESEAAENMAVVAAVQEGEITPVANLWDFERENNPDPNKFDSHPYGLAADPAGTLLVADAGGNSLLRVDPASGEVEVVAVFEGLPGPLPNPERGDAMEADPVPTGIVVGEDGTIFVSLLSGFPFVPGSAKVVQVSAEGEVSDFATGLTMLTDLRMGPDGNLYAVQFGLFTEQGPQPNSGAIVRVQEGDASEVVVDGLSFPTSLDFDADGNAYVTINGVGAPASGQVVKFAELAAGEAGSN